MKIDWSKIKLVVFDVDGTLYDQRWLRFRMAMKLIADCVNSRSLRTAQVLRMYRKEREIIAVEELENFETILLLRVSARSGLSIGNIEAIVHDWIETRPLEILRASRYSQIADFFELLHASGRRIGILSDYPARDKLAALDLHYDIIVSATDDQVKMLKPNPRGLERVIEIAGVGREATIFIGDRQDRDGVAGARAGVKTFITCPKSTMGLDFFRSYRDFVDGNKLTAPDGGRKT